jgi:hypothetical protein
MNGIGGAKRDRTADLLHAMQWAALAFCFRSYPPVSATLSFPAFFTYPVSAGILQLEIT